MPTITAKEVQDHLDRIIQEGGCVVRAVSKIKFFSKLRVSNFFDEANEIDFHFMKDSLMAFRILSKVAKNICISFFQKVSLLSGLSKNVPKKLLSYLSAIQNQVDRIS
ncbi:hypothetical protein [Chryseobacterium foetidum]|uniref:hypothetical protein n=1 Tax=Chryseobacterium foetidum TaxID=2951057 RepID=UPI0021C9F314|nr:hypothetical protein [Chryseobacterium foetidum]